MICSTIFMMMLFCFLYSFSSRYQIHQIQLNECFEYASSIEIVFWLFFLFRNANGKSWTHFNLNCNLDWLQFSAYHNSKWSFCGLKWVHHKNANEWNMTAISFGYLFDVNIKRNNNKNHRNLYLIKIDYFGVK